MARRVQVFICWSGERSKFIATKLREWIPKVIQATEPWMSEEDIRAGARWQNDISQRLAETKFGIVALTRDSLEAPWVLFEAGALAKIVEGSFVCPYLIDIEKSELTGPLTQFQAKKADRDGTRDLVRSANAALGDAALATQQVDENFDVWWPQFEKHLQKLPPVGGPAKAQRSSKDILDEILETVRELDRSMNNRILGMLAALDFQPQWTQRSLDDDPEVMHSVLRSARRFLARKIVDIAPPQSDQPEGDKETKG